MVMARLVLDTGLSDLYCAAHEPYSGEAFRDPSHFRTLEPSNSVESDSGSDRRSIKPLHGSADQGVMRMDVNSVE